MASKKLNTGNANTLKVPPYNEEAEQAVLGSILIDKESMIKVYDLLKPEDFYFEKHQIIWELMMDHYNHHKPIDLLTISNSLEEKKQLKDAGGLSYLAELSAIVPSASHIYSYGILVKDKSTRRKMIRAGDAIMGYGYNEENKIGDDLERSEKEVFQISQAFLKNKFISIKEILSGRFELYAELHEDPESANTKGVLSGFRGLDDMLNGFKGSDMVIIAARPSMGKTAFALNIAQNVAMQAGKKIGIFSLEMSKEQLVDRLICMTTQIDSWKLHKGKLEDEEFSKLGVGIDELNKAPIFIDDTVGSSLAEVRAKARRLQMEHGLDMIIIDYLQLMTTGGNEFAGNRVQEISEISRSIKQLGRELNIPIICLSQLSRAVEARPGKIPQLADLRDSGSIEQDADVVAMIFREEYYEPDTDRPGMTDIFIKKNRNGPVGRVELKWMAESMKFMDVDTRFDD
ncbi:replicative DNA helicase [Candidatus Peregrinibacteria bacterium]|nr:replicative DNA helicase [Candidatus Peregrinibacteria bacterium]